MGGPDTTEGHQENAFSQRQRENYTRLPLGRIEMRYPAARYNSAFIVQNIFTKVRFIMQ